MNDLAAIQLSNAIRKISGVDKRRPDTFVFGTVKNMDPIEIDIGNNMILTKEFLFIGQACRPHKVKIPHTHIYNGNTENAGASSSATAVMNKGDLTVTGQATVVEIQGHNHEIKEQVTENVHKDGSDYEKCVVIEIEPKLKKGDVVLLFAFNNYQMYYVAERLEE